MKSGVPDVLVFTPAPRGGGPCAVELKRTRGGQVSATQHAWLDALAKCGWHVYVARGADEAIKQLQALGY